HLRHNKSIDREIFLESLNLLSKRLNIQEYTYIGFGGPMLEDFRIMHNRIALSDMISLEEQESTHIRQKYNLPYNCIDCKLISAHDFILDYSFSKPSITWLDYASPKKIQTDLDDIHLLSTKVSSFDILKVTFPINPSSYYQRRVGESLDIFKEAFINSLKSLLGKKYLDFNLQISNADLSDRKIKALLIRIITNAFRSAIERGLSGRKDKIQYYPLSLNQYNDGSHTMLTISGFFSSEQEYIELSKACDLSNWQFYSTNWEDVQEIAIPTLTIKEKINLDSKLPDKEAYQAAAEEFSLNENERDNYYKYYRLY
ncbi:O-methyltransferase, partial [Escherichia coli]